MTTSHASGGESRSRRAGYPIGCPRGPMARPSAVLHGTGLRDARRGLAHGTTLSYSGDAAQDAQDACPFERRHRLAEDPHRNEAHPDEVQGVDGIDGREIPMAQGEDKQNGREAIERDSRSKGSIERMRDREAG